MQKEIIINPTIDFYSMDNVDLMICVLLIYVPILCYCKTILSKKLRKSPDGQIIT